MVRARQGGGGGRGLTMEESRTSRCEDCGNKAKKECLYMRCRTCCNNKGFHCQTHVKSTWVPLYKRSSLHLLHHHHPEQQQQQQQEGRHLFINPNKRLRQHHPSSSSSAGMDQEVNFPAEVNTMANFKGVRVSSMDEMVDLDQYAYQTSVTIGGHVFSGILYDQGPAAVHHHQMMTCYSTTTSSSAAAADQPNPPSSFSYHQFVNPFNSDSMPAGTQFFPNLSS